MSSVIVNRYTQALFRLAKQKKIAEKLYTDFQQFLVIAKTKPALATCLKNPLISVADKERVLASFTDVFQPYTLYFFRLVNKKKRAGLLLDMGADFIARYKKEQKMQVAYITAAHPLTNDMQQKLLKLAKKLSGGTTIELITNVDPNLLGGYVLKLGEHCLDASLRTHLRQLSQHWCT